MNDPHLPLAEVVAALNVGIESHVEHPAVTYFHLRDGRTIALWDEGYDHGVCWRWEGRESFRETLERVKVELRGTTAKGGDAEAIIDAALARSA